jgi:hypothetical protein
MTWWRLSFFARMWRLNTHSRQLTDKITKSHCMNHMGHNRIRLSTRIRCQGSSSELGFNRAWRKADSQKTTSKLKERYVNVKTTFRQIRNQHTRAKITTFMKTSKSIRTLSWTMHHCTDMSSPAPGLSAKKLAMRLAPKVSVKDITFCKNFTLGICS